MSRRTRFFVSVLIAVGAWATLAPAALGRGAGASDIRLVSSQRLDKRLTELTLRTPAIAHDTGVRGLLPHGYAAHPNRRYPTLYLLHGSGGNETDWTEMGDAEKATAGYPMIVVMPDADQNGYYSDWYNGGAFGPPRYETYDIRELIPWIDSHYRTVAARRGRALAGLSMGGFGALTYAARHPDLFVAAASFSGAVNNMTNGGQVLDVFAMEDGGTPGDIWGPQPTEEVRWRAHNPVDLAANLRGLSLTVRTGNGEPGGPYGGGPDGLEAGVHQMSVELHERLAALHVAHVWDDYGPGAHDWPYWARDLRETLPSMMAA